MEHYDIVEQLGKRFKSQCNLYKNGKTGKKCVLKEVECVDKHAVKKADDEAKILMQMKHLHIYKLKKYFTRFDEQTKSIYVCTVTDVMEGGDLAKQLIKQRNILKESFSQDLLIRWICQLVEALSFVHSNGVIHKNLKPNNIYLASDKSLIIGDFGIAADPSAYDIVTRASTDCWKYIAPEVPINQFTESSDIWSLGCILLELVSCGFLDCNQMHSEIIKLRSNANQVQEVLIKLKEENISPELVDFIRQTLLFDAKMRPNAHNLLDHPYLKEYLTATTQDGSNQISIDLPTDKGIEGVINFLQSEMSRSVCTQQVFDWLLHYPEEMRLKPSDIMVLSNAFSKHSEDLSISLLAVNFFTKKCPHLNSIMESSLTETLIPNILNSMQTSKKSLDLQQSSISLLMHLAVDENVAAFIGKLGGIKIIIENSRNFQDDLDLSILCCKILWELCIPELNLKIATADDVFGTICQYLQTFSKDPEIQEHGAVCLIALSMADKTFERINDLQVIRLLLEALKNHIQSSDVSKAVCQAIASFVELDEEAALSVIECDASSPDLDPISGLKLLTATYDLHKENEEVVTAVVKVYRELSSHADLRLEIRSVDLIKMIEQIRKKYFRNQIIRKCCEQILGFIKTIPNIGK